MLILPIKRKWFDMILSGEKREEYRLSKRHWRSRIAHELTLARASGCKPEVEFRCGYSALAPRATFEIESIFERLGRPVHPEWGEPSDWHYVLRLGRRLSVFLADTGSGGGETVVCRPFAH